MDHYLVITALAATPQLISEIPQVFQYNGIAYFEMQPGTIYHHRHHVSVSLQLEYGLSFDRDQMSDCPAIADILLIK